MHRQLRMKAREITGHSHKRSRDKISVIEVLLTLYTILEL